MSAEPLESPSSRSIEESIREVLERQRRAHLSVGPPSVAVRRDRLDRAIGLLVDHRDEIVESLSADFGHRSPDQTLFTDVASSIEPLKFARKHFERWMKPERRRPQFPFGLLGARAEVRYQPLGVVGIISPWNFPVNLTFAPLAGVLSAGNRAMIKPSELTPATSALMGRMFAEAFEDTEIAVFTGGPEVGAAFSRQPFDHLLFTGATGVARHVMRAAAENLVPVTLELGGKSPVVIGETADLDDAARKIMTGKMLNAGQICLAPDYVFIGAERVADFVAATRRAVARMYPSLEENPDYTAVVDERHSARLNGYLEDARSRGVEVVDLAPAGESGESPVNKMAPALLLDPPADATVMQEEIFGPLLPILSYTSIGEVIDEVNRRPRPLALYYFGRDAEERRALLERTTSGGVTVNDVVMHVAQEDLPFGGVGPSGMGSYHGRDGFRTFSHAKSVFTQARVDVGAMLRPPYGKRMRSLVERMIRR